ncbi:MAG: methyltransferase domain-containing protein [Ruminococcaceae bacterium]|nr:methyltransferase domain-containing protein [Oscillospiraceae bacterium]
MSNQTQFFCPVCSLPLSEEEKSFTCPKNHCFDKAKQGYVNLLISNKQGTHGDDKLMVKARQSFLEKGYYGKLRDEIEFIIGKGNVLLDAGCGEGYYTSCFSENNDVFGIDISKEALKIAARKCKNARFAVASIYDIPLCDESVDVVVNIFAPDSPSEYLRLIKPNGRLIMVTPMENHLMELKKAVYDNPYTNAYVEPSRDGFVIKSQKEVKYEINLETNEDIISLFKMTPYYYNTSQKDIHKLDGYNDLVTRVEFLITEYEKI